MYLIDMGKYMKIKKSTILFKNHSRKVEEVLVFLKTIYLGQLGNIKKMS